MRAGKFPTHFMAGLFLSTGLLTGCAAFPNWFMGAGTYAVATSEEMELGGRGQVHGTLMVADRLSEVMMDTGKGFPPSLPIRTRVTVQPTGLELETDAQGQFVLPHLEPGSYSIAFTEPAGREIWARFQVNADERLLVMVWVQRDGAYGINSPDGTPPRSMFPGTHAYAPIESGYHRSSGGRGGSGGGGIPH